LDKVEEVIVATFEQMPASIGHGRRWRRGRGCPSRPSDGSGGGSSSNSTSPTGSSCPPIRRAPDLRQPVHPQDTGHQRLADQAPRFHLHFTPTGSSWINQVERWFGYLTDQLLRRGVHKNVQTLEKDVREWIKTWNEDPKPFVWTKTAEEILNSLARCISRISGAGH